ncbi:hypothetical protein JCM10213_000964 [Rhodosporidiobolus nylandii]
MCDFIPLCFTCGCDKQLSQEGSQAHVCPRCNNGSVYATKERNCFTFCFVPLVPLGSEHVWHCTICQWQASQSGPAPPVAGQPGAFYGPQPGYGGGGYAPQGTMGYPQQQMQPGYAAPQGYGR